VLSVSADRLLAQPKEGGASSTDGCSSTQRALHQRKESSRRGVSVLQELNVSYIHDRLNVRGEAVRVAIVDTGINSRLTPFRHTSIRKCVSLTRERSTTEWCRDGHGHGTFGASIIAGHSDDGACEYGLAPKAELYIFKVFSDRQSSFTSWFVEAFNMLLQLRVDIVNFSFGGMDYEDALFVEKIHELSLSGVTVVTASGNDGPHHSQRIPASRHSPPRKAAPGRSPRQSVAASQSRS
jgi:membrane-bound transcription factor site-1 protease